MSSDSENIRQGWMSRLSFYSFLVLVGSLGFPQIPIHLFGLDVLVTDLLFLVTGAIWAVSLIPRQRQIVWSRSYWMLALYLASLLVSAVFSIDRVRSFERFPEEGYLVCLAVLAINIIDSVKDLKHVIFAWLIGTTIAVAIGLATVPLFYASPSSPLLEYLTYHYGSVPVGNYPRITAGFVSASMLCDYLNVGVVLAFLASMKRWLSSKLLTILILTILLAGLFTLSIGLGGFALAIAIYVWFFTDSNDSVKRLTLLLGCSASLFFLLLSFFALAPYPNAHVLWTVPFIHADLLPSARMMVWNDAIKTFLSHPITGIGLGEPVANVIFGNTEGGSSLLTDAHNSFLSVAAQNGIIGLAAFTCLVIVILKRWWLSIQNERSLTILNALGIAFFCSFVYQGLTGSFEDSRHLWVLIGMFWAADRVEQSQT